MEGNVLAEQEYKKIKASELDTGDMIFVSNSQDVKAIKDQFKGMRAINSFDSFFVEIIDGEYNSVYGMVGIIPWMTNNLYQLI